MNGPAYLFIKKQIITVATDSVICTNSKLANSLGTIVHFKEFQEQCLVLVGRSLHHFALRKTQTDTFDKLSGKNCGKFKCNVSFRTVICRSGIDFTTGHVNVSVVNQVFSSCCLETEISTRADNSDLFRSLHELPDCIVTFAFFLPVKQCCIEEKLHHFVCTQFCLLGKCSVGNPYQDPAGFFGS